MIATATITIKKGAITAIHPVDSCPYQLGDKFTIIERKMKRALLVGGCPISLECIPVGMWLECYDRWWYLVWME
jgi:hypothetical protein